MKFIFINPIRYEWHETRRCVSWRWRKLIIFDSVNCANSAVTQVRKWAVDIFVQNNNNKTIVNTRVWASFDSSWSLARDTVTWLHQRSRTEISVRPYVSCETSTALDITLNNHKANLHHIHSEPCGFCPCKNTHVHRDESVCVPAVLTRRVSRGSVCVRAWSDQLERAMVSITCSSLDLSLCLRDCSSRSSADRICADNRSQ